MSIIDDILKKHNVKYEILTPDEKEVLFKLVADAEQSKLTPEKMLFHVSTLRLLVEEALINEPEFNYIFIFKVPNRKQILLKARLQNYMMFETFLQRPEKARKALEQSIANVNL
jgi:hypothetical protein